MTAAVLAIVGLLNAAVLWLRLSPRRTARAKLLAEDARMQRALTRHCLEKAERCVHLGQNERARAEMDWAMKYAAKARELEAEERAEAKT